MVSCRSLRSGGASPHGGETQTAVDAVTLILDATPSKQTKRDPGWLARPVNELRQLTSGERSFASGGASPQRGAVALATDGLLSKLALRWGKPTRGRNSDGS